jgi:CheY-like chemotaxis protein
LAVRFDAMEIIAAPETYPDQSSVVSLRERTRNSYGGPIGGRDDRIALIHEIEAAVEPLDSNVMAVTGEGYFDALSQRSNREIRLELAHRCGVYPDEDRRLWFETIFYGAAIRYAVARAVQPFGLHGGEALIHRAVRALIDEAKDEGRFASLASVAGQVNVLTLLGRLIPLGVWHGDVYELTYGALLRVKPRDAVRFAGHFARHMGGAGPVLRLYLPPQPNTHVTAEDYVKAHFIAADLMRANPRIRALFQSTWYIDPKLKDISPHLSFLNRFATSYGSIIGRVGSDDEVVREATWKSGNRRRLHEAGRYVPTRYYRLWPRDLLLRWADAAPAPRAVADTPTTSSRSDEAVIPSPAVEDPEPARKIVLVVDGDPQFQSLAREAVEASGHQVSVVADLATALGLGSRLRHVDLLIAAVMQPNGGNGVRLAQEVRRRNLDAQAVLTSDQVDAGNAGPRGYMIAGVRVVPKPRTIEEFAQLVDGYLPVPPAL